MTVGTKNWEPTLDPTQARETSPGSTPGCATERARHHRQTGALNHHFLTLLRKAEHVLGSVSFYWDKRFNKVQFRSKHPRAKAARFFPSFSVEIQAAILENWRIHLGISQTTSTELEGTLDRTRRWIAGATEWNHVPYHPVSPGPEMDRIRWFYLIMWIAV